MGLANFGTHHFFLKKFFSMRILNLKLKLLLFLVLPLAACYVEYLYGFLWPLCPFVPEMADAVSQRFLCQSPVSFVIIVIRLIHWNELESVGHAHWQRNLPFDRDSLERMIGGQKRALDAITSSIAGWEFRRKSGNADPLVLAISGPPGVGKSETGMLLILIQRRNTTSVIRLSLFFSIWFLGFRIAEAIFGMSTTIGKRTTIIFIGTISFNLIGIAGNCN